MIITRLQGGIGNQMFQYATGRRLAHVLKTRLKLDVSGFQYESFRDYALDNFSIKADIADEAEILVCKPEKKGPIRRLFNRMQGRQILSGGRQYRYFKEKFFRFDPEVLNLGDNVYLDGYWQSEKYFADVTPIIRQEFRIKEPQSQANSELCKTICSKESVSIHVRRGDYVSNALVSSIHGTCDLSFYDRSIERIESYNKNVHYFVFSDEPAWIRDHLNLPLHTTFIEHNKSDKAYEDMRLMSMCKHHIIANSSFSWWGAWLNPDPDKIVIAPSRWFKNRDYVADDLLPEGWIRL
jgi:hypothetical protein